MMKGEKVEDNRKKKLGTEEMVRKETLCRQVKIAAEIIGDRKYMKMSGR